jgi:predicted O-linked N-acetylglucosamine transferase (SPINDLY family)
MAETPKDTPEQLTTLVEQALRLEPGDPEAAGLLYQRALALDPEHFPALYLHGDLRERRGDHEAAADLLERAVMVNPRSAGAHASLGRALWGLHRPEEALSHLGRALMYQPDDVDALLNRGIVLRHLARPEEALASLDRALALRPGLAQALLSRSAVLLDLERPEAALADCDLALEGPDQAEALLHRGNALMELQRPLEALADYDRVLALQPDRAEALTNRGLACLRLGRPEEALVCSQRLLAVQPGHVLAWSNRCAALLNLKRYAEALESADRILALSPGHTEALVNRSTALLSLNRFGEALESADRALAQSPGQLQAMLNRCTALLNLNQSRAALDCIGQVLVDQPGHVDAWLTRAAILIAINRCEEALESADQALALSPGNPGALLNRGSAWRELNQPSMALDCFDRILGDHPDHADAWLNRGSTLYLLGRHQEAMDSFARALAIQPGRADIHSNKIFVRCFLPDTTFAQYQDEMRAFARTQTRGIQAQATHGNDLDPDRRLVVGYVSADFKRHSAASVFGSIVFRHDRDRFRIICYSGVLDEDDYTQRFRQLADPWREVAGLSDDALAQQIRADGVDILVDLSGHTRGNRLLVFARKPAPIQVNAWGGLGGTGLPAVDYQFADPVYIPESYRPLCVDPCYDLPCCQTFDPPADAPDVGPLPARSHGAVTFGSLNRFSKVSPAALAQWARILSAVPGSRLLIKDPGFDDPALRRRVLDTMAGLGIAPAQIELRGKTSRRDHLAAYNEVDIVLDTYPISGGITTWEALWMGAPVVALLGQIHVSRVSGAILHALGLGDWVAASEADYAALAVRRAGDLEDLARLRVGMRERILASDAGNPDRYTRAVEAAYRDMWHHWLGQHPAP